MLAEVDASQLERPNPRDAEHAKVHDVDGAGHAETIRVGGYILRDRYNKLIGLLFSKE